MAITAEHYLLRRPQRRKPWRWVAPLLLLLAAPIVAIVAFRSGVIGASEAGIGKPLNLIEIKQLPDWAREVIHDQQLGADYQFVATLVDLDRDQQYEILLAAATPRPDLFVADHPLAVIHSQDQDWHYQATPVSCRPARLGSFLTNGRWDLPCRTATGPVILRWSGSAYEIH